MSRPDPTTRPASTLPSLTSREVCQWLRDAALGTARLDVLVVRHDRLCLAIDGCTLVLLTDEQRLSCFQACDPQGRQGMADQWGRPGTDPIELLSTWERAQLDRLLDIDTGA